MAATWMETVAEAQRRAKRRLPRSVYSALLAGNERGVSYRDNMNAFSEPFQMLHRSCGRTGHLPV